MATVKEEIAAEIAALRAKADAMEAEAAKLPAEVHALATEAWTAIKAFFAKL